jgi:ubiquitin C-terminal hydrolase
MVFCEVDVQAHPSPTGLLFNEELILTQKMGLNFSLPDVLCISAEHQLYNYAITASALRRFDDTTLRISCPQEFKGLEVEFMSRETWNKFKSITDQDRPTKPSPAESPLGRPPPGHNSFFPAEGIKMCEMKRKEGDAGEEAVEPCRSVVLDESPGVTVGGLISVLFLVNDGIFREQRKPGIRQSLLRHCLFGPRETGVGQKRIKLIVSRKDKLWDVVRTFISSPGLDTNGFMEQYRICDHNFMVLHPLSDFSELSDGAILTLSKIFRNREGRTLSADMLTRMPPKGLMNQGNTCFMNSGLQCLINCRLLTEYFLESSGLDEKAVDECDRERMVYNAYMQLVCSIYSEETEVAIPRELKCKMGAMYKEYMYFEQQDVAEFITRLLDAIHEVSKNRGAMPERDVNNNKKGTSDDSGAEDDASEAGVEEAATGVGGEMDGSEGKKMVRKDSGLGKSASDQEELETPVTKTSAPTGSVVRNLFFFNLVSELWCCECNNKKIHTDPSMVLPLSVPSYSEYKEDIILFYNSSTLVPIKIHANAGLKVSDLKKILRTEYRMEGDILCMRYEGVKSMVELMDSTPIGTVPYPIFCYEYSGKNLASYYWLQIKNAGWVYDTTFAFNFLVSIPSRDEKAVFGVMLNVLTPLVPNEEYHLLQATVFSSFSLRFLPSSPGDGIVNRPLIVARSTRKLDLKIFSSDFDPISEIKPVGSSLNTLRGCLEGFCEDEVLGDSGLLECEKCKKRTGFVKRTQIADPPTYFIVQLKRFQHVNGRSRKINTFIDYPLDEFWFCGYNYRAIAISTHDSNLNISSGHYVSYLRKGEDWYLCNDDKITRVHKVDKKYTYVLVLERVT